jgi:hypothetical protein
VNSVVTTLENGPEAADFLDLFAEVLSEEDQD